MYLWLSVLNAGDLSGSFSRGESLCCKTGSMEDIWGLQHPEWLIPSANFAQCLLAVTSKSLGSRMWKRKSTTGLKPLLFSAPPAAVTDHHKILEEGRCLT